MPRFWLGLRGDLNSSVGVEEPPRSMMVEGPKLVRQAVAVFDDVDGLKEAEAAIRQIGQGTLETTLLVCRDMLKQTSADRLLREYESGRPIRTVGRRREPSKRKVDSDLPAVGPVGLIEVGQIGASKPILSSAGALADLLSQAGAQPGASIRLILQTWMPEKQSVFLEDQLGAGKILFWVHIQDADHEASVCRVLLKHSPYRVQVYDLRSAPHDKPKAT